jgi:hypothetical protein
MKITDSVLRLITALSFGFMLAGCETAPPTIQTGADAELSYDGLHLVDNSQADVAWARPDFNLDGYTKIWPVGAEVEYKQVKDTGRSSMARSRGGPYFIDDKARGQFEELVSRTFNEELQKIENYALADGPGPDVLMIRGGLINVTSMVPPDPMGARSDIYLSNVGDATLVLELRDSETHAILARSVDRRAAESIGDTFQRSNSVTNAADVKRLIRFWATRLREGLDGFAEKTAGN